MDGIAAKIGATKQKDLKPQSHHFFYVVVWLMGIIAPPVAVAMRFGIGRDFFINVLCTLCGYFPGHGHNFYCQTIRNNNNKARTPKWAVKYGLVKPLDERGGKHQWAGRYDERLPDSSRREYDDPSSSSTLPSTNETWDGRGPEPPVKDAATNRNGLSARPPPSTGESEEFFPSGSQAGGSIKGGSSIKKGKKKGLKGLFGNRRSRYENQEPEGAGGDRFEKMNSAHGVAATPVERTGYEIDDIAPSLGENRGREEEYADEFERELNGGGRKATANGNADPWAIPAKGNDDPWAIKSPKEDSQTAQGSKDPFNHTF